MEDGRMSWTLNPPVSEGGPYMSCSRKPKNPGAKSAPGAPLELGHLGDARGKRCRGGLGTGHGIQRREGAVGHGDVDFANGAIDFGGTRGSFEAVGEEKTLQSDKVGPDTFEGHDIFGLQFVELALGIEHAGTRSEHL